MPLFLKNNRVSLQNVRYSAAESRETMCFTVEVLFDGEPAFMAENTGRGGADRHYPIKGQPRAECDAAIHKVQAWANALPPEDMGNGASLGYSIERVAADALNAWLTLRDTRRKCRTWVLVMKPGATEFSKWKKPLGGKLTPDQLKEGYQVILSKSPPGSVIVNDMTDKELIDAYERMYATAGAAPAPKIISKPEPSPGPTFH